jgi:hypothetical protein
MSEMIDLKKEKNFFETRVTDYQTGGALFMGLTVCNHPLAVRIVAHWILLQSGSLSGFATMRADVFYAPAQRRDGLSLKAMSRMRAHL